MPSDVHIEQSPTFKGPMETTDPGQTESIYLQRYKALRDAGFDETTANKYSPLYSSVNEVIDAILSQSLNDNLAINSNESYSLYNGTNNQSNNGTYKNSNNSTELDITKNDLIMVSAPNNDCHQQIKNLDGTDCNDLVFCPNDATSFANNNYNIEHPHSNSNQTYKANGKNSNLIQSFMGVVGNSESESETSRANNNNLIATMLKDGLLEDSSDEITLEDEGLTEQNANSSSPSASSSLSSGISSFFMDTSSSPSSFSSLSSSISITPPNQLGNFDSNQNENNINGSLVSLFLTKHKVPSNNIVQTTNQKLKSNESNEATNGYLHNGIETNDLNCETLDNLSMKSNHRNNANHNNDSFGDQQKSINSMVISKSYINNNNNRTNKQTLMFDAKFYGNQTDLVNQARLNQCGKHTNNSLGPLVDSNNDSNAFDTGYHSQIGNLQLTIDKSDVRENIFDQKNCIGKSCNNNEESTLNDLLGYLNLQQCQPFFNFDQNTTNELIPGFNNGGGGGGGAGENNFNIGTKNDLFAENIMEIKNNYNHLFAASDNADSIYNACSSETELNNSSNHYHTFLNHQSRTFADIAASTLNGSTTDDSFIGLLDSQKANLNSLITNGSNGYYSAFTSNIPVANAIQSFYDHYDQNGLNKKYFRKQLNYRTAGGAAPLSPINEKILKTGQTKEQQQQQLSFIGSTSIRATNSILSLEGHLTTENGIESNLPVNGTGTSTVNSQFSNRPTNLMAYKGLWVCNVSPDVGLHYLKRRFRRYGHFTGIQTFERRATNGTNIVFVHYDNPHSPVEAIAALHNYSGQDLCADPNEPLKLRFAPSMEQSRAGHLPTLEQARKIVEKSGECFNWRLSSGCHRGSRCHLKHVSINKEIDSQPWVKALKKKINDT